MSLKLRSSLGFILTPLVIIGICVTVLNTLYTSVFDKEYLNDLYDHSQYSIAESKRQMGDGQVYQVIGDRLVNRQGSVFTIDPQVPPLGKTLIGYSIKYFKNAYVINLFTMTFSAWGVWIIIYLLTKSVYKSQIGMLLFLLEPLILSQLKQTMLDIIQLNILIFHILFFILAIYPNNKNYKQLFYFSVSGMLLGLFGAIKFGLLMPFFFLLSIATIFIYVYNTLKTPRKLATLLIFVCAFFFTVSLGYLLGHLQFFTEGGTLLQFLKNEKWLVSFWMNGNAKGIFAMPIITLFTGLYRHFTKNSSWQWLAEWSVLNVLFGWVIFKNRNFIIKKSHSNNLPFQYLLFYVLTTLLVYSLIPFYYRYFTLVVPLLIILSVSLVQKIDINTKKLRLFIILLFLITFVKDINILYDQPERLSSQIKRNFENATFQDLYPTIAKSSLQSENRIDFWERTYLTQYQLDNPKREMRISNIVTAPWTSQIQVPYVLTYTTTLGLLQTKGNLEYVREGHEWKLVWNDRYIWDFYQKGDRFNISLDDDVYYGSLYINGKKILTVNENAYLVLDPRSMVDEEATIKQIMLVTGQNKFTIENKYKSNHIQDLPVNLGPVLPLHQKSVSKKKLLPGISVVYKKEYPPLSPEFLKIAPRVGGTILLVKRTNETQLLMKVDSIDGQDVYVK